MKISIILSLALLPILTCAKIGGVYKGWQNGAKKYFKLLPLSQR
jgi:hypothetical protein